MRAFVTQPKPTSRTAPKFMEFRRRIASAFFAPTVGGDAATQDAANALLAAAETVQNQVDAWINSELGRVIQALVWRDFNSLPGMVKAARA